MFEVDISRALQKLQEMAELGLLGAFGAVASTAFSVAHKRKVFRLGVFICNVIVAAFVGNVMGALLGDSPHKDSTIMLCGFFAYPLLEALEARVKGTIEQVLGRVKL
jgi:hypothetical protein